MTRTERYTGIFALCLLAGAAWLWLSPRGFSPAPDVTFNVIDGRKLDLASYRGRPVLITFWATTCSSCVAEIPHLVELYELLQPKGLEIVGVAMSYDPPNQVLRMATDRALPYPIALDVQGDAARAFGNVTLTPTTFLIGPDGRIVRHRIGPFDVESIRADITTMLGGGA